MEHPVRYESGYPVNGPFRKHGTVAVSSTGSLNMIGAAMALLLEPPMRKMEPLPETAAVPCFRKGLKSILTRSFEWLQNFSAMSMGNG